MQMEALPMPRQITFEANPGKLQEMVDSAINRALINQSSVLSNTIFNVVARTFKEGEVPLSYVGPAYHQPRSSLVTAPSATTAIAGTEATTPSTLEITNALSTPMTTIPSTSEGQIKPTTDLLASAMSGSVPPNWWGYGMPPEFMAKNSGTSQAADVTGKATMASAPPGPPMTQNPSILQLLLQDLLLGILKCQCSRCLNASADPMSMQQRFMTQPGYVNSMMMPNYQSSAGPTLMNVNNGWTGQFVFPQVPHQKHQAMGFQQGPVQP